MRLGVSAPGNRRNAVLLAAILLTSALAILGSWKFGLPTGPFNWLWLANILLVGAIALWAVAHVARKQGFQAELARALDSAVVVITTLDGRITYWSQGCRRFYGWSAAEAIGQNKYCLMQSRCQSWRAGLPEPSGTAAHELIEMHRSGRELWLIEHVHRVDGISGEPSLVMAITDVSARIHAVAALQASEERLAQATSGQRLGVFEWHVPTGEFVWLSGSEERLGVEPGSMSSFASWAKLVEPDDLKEFTRALDKAKAAQAENFSYRYRFRKHNGQVGAVEGSSRAFYDRNGQLTRTVGVVLDVTERHRREATLRAQESQLRSILETVPDAMVVFDEHGIIHAFSAAAEKLWGYPAEEVIGRDFGVLAAPDERSRNTLALARFLKVGERRSAILARGQKADGLVFPAETRMGVAKTDKQTLFTLFVRDLTEQLAAEERLSQLSAELTRVSRQSAMGEFAADLAHELNQPLSAASNFLAAGQTLVERGEGGERVAEMLRLASEQALRAGEIIRRLLALATHGEVEMRAESLEATIRDAAELVLVMARQFQITVRYELDPDAVQVYVDRIQIQQVIVNLLRNAIEVLRDCPAGAREIVIGSHKLSGAMVEIDIADTGPGLSEPVLAQLFSRFATTKGKGGGMGLGLSISKRIIEAHGGALRASNRATGGACFQFTLPEAESGARG